MKENDLSLYKLNKICDLSINTLRKIINNPSHNTNLETLNILAQVFDCSIKDLIEDNPSTINYEKAVEEFDRNHLFSPENIEYLKKILLQVGILCKISSYGNYKTATIKSEYELSSIQVDINIRVVKVINKTYMHVINFYSQVNQSLLNETLIKDALIKALEIYAQRTNFDEIRFTIDQDFERKIDQYSNSQSEITANFTYTLGTESSLFIKNNYEHSSYPEFEKYQVEWRKNLK